VLRLHPKQIEKVDHHVVGIQAILLMVVHFAAHDIQSVRKATHGELRQKCSLAPDIPMFDVLLAVTARGHHVHYLEGFLLVGRQQP